MSHTASVSTESTPHDEPGANGGRLRVLFVIDGLAYNGAVAIAASVAPWLRRIRVEAELFALLPVEPRRRVPVDVSVRVTEGASHRLRMRWMFPRAVLHLLLAARRADVVVAVSEVGPGLLLASLAARVTRKPFATMVHADLGRAVEQWVAPRLRQATYRAHRRADAVVCVAEALVPSVLAHGLDRRRVHVVTTGVDVARVRALSVEQPQLEPAVVPRVVGLGRLSEEKGFDLLVRAHAAVRAAGVDHELLVIGEGPLRQPLLRLADELGVGASVHLPGFVENAFAIVAGATVFVLPSRREGFPLSLIEALALGVPVIASRCSPGVSEILAAGELGELVEPGSVDELADALRRHLAKPDHLRDRAKIASTRVARYDIGQTAGRLAEILRPLAGSRVAHAGLPIVSGTTTD